MSFFKRNIKGDKDGTYQMQLLSHGKPNSPAWIRPKTLGQSREFDPDFMRWTISWSWNADAINDGVFDLKGNFLEDNLPTQILDSNDSTILTSLHVFKFSDGAFVSLALLFKISVLTLTEVRLHLSPTVKGARDMDFSEYNHQS